MKTLSQFLLACLGVGAVALMLSWAVWGPGVAFQALVAFLVTFLPAAISLGWLTRQSQSQPNQLAIVGLGGSGVRMAVALGAGLLLPRIAEGVFSDAFLIWLAGFYLVLLSIELLFIVKMTKAAGAVGPAMAGLPAGVANQPSSK